MVALLAALTSWVVLRLRPAGARILDLLAFMPLAIPGVMMGVALIQVYLSIGRYIPIYGTIWIIVVAYTTQYLSYGSRATNSALLQLHPELEEAGRMSGGSGLSVARRITLPLLTPALLAVWIWVVAHSLRELSAALMLQGRSNSVLPTLLWDYWSGGELNKAASVGVWLGLALLACVVIWQWLQKRISTIAGK
jgi:iron(III) transport system permease protein